MMVVSDYWSDLLQLSCLRIRHSGTLFCDHRLRMFLQAELNQQLELLEYLARAAPRVVVSFLGQELDNVLRLIETVGHGENLDRLNAVLSELLDDTDTGSTAFDL